MFFEILVQNMRKKLRTFIIIKSDVVRYSVFASKKELIDEYAIGMQFILNEIKRSRHSMQFILNEIKGRKQICY